ncbi:MAG: hypothetical protein CM15mP83_2040 [Flavobacteriaceae bacterium]|nr:MAG: hypothetical protein CM15mP83_2040 [Flavobacteriaceae bacterium]
MHYAHQTEGVAHCNIDISFLCLVEREVYFWVDVFISVKWLIVGGTIPC